MANKPLAAYCDAGCKKEFIITKIRTRKLRNGIDKNYFTCPHCKQEYVTYYASAETLKLQKAMRKLHVRLGKEPAVLNGDAEEERLKRQIKQSMDEARAIAEG